MNQRYFSCSARRALWAVLCLVLVLNLKLGGRIPTVRADLGTDFVWVGTEMMPTTSVAWGDWDGDGDLDLVVGNEDVNQVYENDGGMLKLDPDNPNPAQRFGWAEDPADARYTTSLAWGDWDGDGDLDLAVGNGGWSDEVNQVYENDGGTLKLDPGNGFGWEEDPVNAKSTTSVAWGDWDGDGDLDLAVGNGGYLTTESAQVNQVYENDGGMLKLDPYNPDPAQQFGWVSPQAQDTKSVAWGDWDGDGDLDLAAGNGGWSDEVNQVYENDGGMLKLDPDNPDPTQRFGWEEDPADARFTTSVAWGDWDGDSDLDLAVGNGGWSDLGEVNQIYENDDGTLKLDPDNPDPTQQFGWVSPDEISTTSVAWGDWDGDGDLDLAVGNGNVEGPGDMLNQVYENDGGTLKLDPGSGFGWQEAASDEQCTSNVTWGDWDSDGDLDLAVGNRWQANRVYENDGEMLILDSGNGFGWQEDASDAHGTHSVAWGDWDSDGDLDLAVGNKDVNQVYENDRGMLKLDPDNPDPAQRFGWEEDPADARYTTSLAWGDWDGDGDLDLAVGNGGWSDEVNRVYENDGGTLKLDPDNPDPTQQFGWVSPDAQPTTSVAWGDWDSDGDLDLAVGNGNFEGPAEEPNQVYENDGGALKLDPGSGFGWEEDPADARRTGSVAWGDWDGDGDLDLAVGNGFDYEDDVNQVYENDGATLKLDPGNDFGWQQDSADARRTTSLAWGDWDGDGDLDLAVGNFWQVNRVYENDEGTLRLDAVRGFGWESTGETDWTTSVAWGDWDGDGDLDLAVGNDDPLYCSPVSKVYENDGETLTMAWTFSLFTCYASLDVAWGDWDSDGDLDLAVGNVGVNQVYENPWRSGTRLGNNPPYAIVPRPGAIDDTFFFSTPQIITQTNVPVTYTLFDFEEEPVSRIIPEFSRNGGGQWSPATPGPGGDGLINLAAAPQGTPHTFVWNADADQVIKNDNLVLRIRVQPSVGPIQWPALDAKSPPFRVAAPQFVRVIDQRGTPVGGAEVYHNGQLIGSTNQAGLLNPGPLTVGDSLVALIQQDEGATFRGEHDGWAYRIYLTNINVDEVGNTQSFTVSQTFGEQLLRVLPENTLVLFNLLVSIEWDATDNYLQDVALAMDEAADFLYDVTDGQMTFGQVAIYDNAQHWTEADIQISTKNLLHPHAHVRGLTDEETTHVIRVGRFWDGHSANQGNWSQPDGYKTLVHEFGHYGLGLWDEYFGYAVVEGQLAGQVPTSCTGLDNRAPETEAINASIMDYHYATSELADVGRWTDWCQGTEQHQLNNGEADWETLLRLYGDDSGQDHWQLLTPDQRTEVMGTPVAGPDRVPSALPFPVVTLNNLGDDPSPFSLYVCYNGVPYRDGAWITLSQMSGTAMDQGLTDDAEGKLNILGARPVDSLQIVSVDGTLSDSVQVAQVLSDGYFDFSPLVPTTLDAGAGPYLRLWPTTSGGLLDGLRLVVSRALPGDNLRYVLTGPDQIGPSAAIPYDAAEGDHRVQVGFIPAALAGYAGVIGSHDGQYVELNADYRLQQATDFTQTLFSNDGNFNLHLDEGSLTLDGVHFLIASPWGLPGPPPSGLDIVGEAYEITASSNVTGLAKPAVLRLRYDTQASEGFDVESLSIYHWDFGGAIWQPLTSTTDTESQEVVTTITDLGIYALIGIPIDTAPLFSSQPRAYNPCQPSGIGDHKTYLPIVLK